MAVNPAVLVFSNSPQNSFQVYPLINSQAPMSSLICQTLNLLFTMLVNYENRYPISAWKSIKSFRNFALTVTRQSPLMRWLIVIHVSHMAS